MSLALNEYTIEEDPVNDFSPELATEYTWFVEGQYAFNCIPDVLQARNEIGVKIMKELTNQRLANHVGTYETKLWYAAHRYMKNLEI